MIFLDPSACKAVIVSTLHNLKVVEEAATHVAESLVMTSLRGVDSHGINLFPHYVRAVRAGRINAYPNMIITQTGESTIKLDADHAFGHYAGSVAMAEAVKMALHTGIGAVSASNSTHFGAAAYFALQATRHNCIGFAFTNADALVKAHGAREAFFGTNPICFAAPLECEEPFCLDMATSLVSWNKVLNFRSRGEKIPRDWAFDIDGLPVEDPSLAVSLSSAGSYKGFGLGMMVDILCALLSDSLVSRDILPMYDSPMEKKRRISHFFLALDIGHFNDPVKFRASLQTLVDRIRIMRPLDSNSSVMVAGDPEKRAYAMRFNSGIPMEETKFNELLNVNSAFAEAVRV